MATEGFVGRQILNPESSGFWSAGECAGRLWKKGRHFPRGHKVPVLAYSVHTVIIRINAAAFIKFLALKMRHLFEGGVYSREAFITNLVTTTVN